MEAPIVKTLSPAAAFASLVLAFAGAACSSQQSTGPAPLEAVSAMPQASPPPLIASVSPAGTAEAGAQIRVRFNDDFVPLTALEDPARSGVLEHFSIAPKIAGRFVIWTPRMVGFVPDAPLPPATRVRVTVTAGLQSLKGARLDADYAWTFATEPLVIEVALPSPDASASDIPQSVLQPAVAVRANAELDADSLASHTHFRSKSEDIGATVSTPSPSPSPYAREGGEQTERVVEYRVTPRHALTRGTLYDVAVDPGVVPATGNLPSEVAAQGVLHTFSDLAFTSVATSAHDRFTGGDPQLHFTNDLAATFDPKLITIAPSPLPVPVIAKADGPDITINPYALAPRTSYTVTVAPGLTDAFGQKTESPVTATFTTSDLAPAFWAPDGYTIFPSSVGVRLNVETANLPTGSYRASFVKLDPKALIAHGPGDPSLLGPKSAWPLQKAPVQPNQTAVTPVALAARLGSPTGLLAYGFSARMSREPDPSKGDADYAGAVALTDVGISVSQFPSEAIVRAQRLRDGEPIAGATVDVYPSLVDAELSRPPGAPPLAIPDACASGATSADGTFEVRGPAFARCAASGTQTYGAPPLYVVVHAGADWSFARTQSYPDYFESVPAGWSAGVPSSHGTLVADHDLFQPGETAHFVAVAYFDENGVLTKATAPSYTITIADPNGVKTAVGVRAPDAFGTFTFDTPFAKNAPLGYYSIDAKAANGEELYGSVRVAQFKPPNFAVKLALERTVATAGETVSATSTSTYLFGSPVDGGTQRWFVTRSPGQFAPKGWDAFTFGRQWMYPETQPDISSDVLQRDVKLDAGAKSSLSVPVGTDIPYPLEYRVEAQTTDASNLSVSDVQSFTVLPSISMVGLDAPYVATAGTPFNVRTIVLDPLGKAVGQSVTLTLQQRVFDNATQIVEGGERADAAVHYIDVGSAQRLSDVQPVSLTLTAPKAGVYRIHATVSGEKNANAATDTYLWVTGPGEIDWGAQDPNRVEVKLDKAVYRPGETVNVLVQSPFAQAQAYVAIVRHGVMARLTQKVAGAAPEFHFTVTPDMLPNAAVQVVLVRRGEPLNASTPASIGKLSRYGMAAFRVALDSKYLRVAARPQSARVLPGGHQTLTLHVADAKGNPVAGQFAVAVVNESVLQLTGYRFPDLTSTVYADMPISLRYADNRSDVTLVSERSPQAKGFGYGGGMMAGLGSTRVRTDFRSLAYFNAAVRTDPGGSASVSFTVPDDLTTWHVLVFALTSDARFGTGDTTFIASKPLVTNPLLPQFARLGDRFDAGVSVTDTLRTKGTLSLAGSTGAGLVFGANGAASQSASLQSPIEQLTQAFRFPVTVTGTGEPTFEFRSGLGRASDAFRVTLPIVTSGVTESVITTGATAVDAAVPLSVDPNVPKTYGGLDVTLASTLVPELSIPIDGVLARKDPFLLTVASQVSAAASAVQLDAALRRPADAHRKALAAATELLRQYFLPDNGFAPWPSASKSELWSTAFAVVALGNARDAGAPVQADLSRASRFLEHILADPGDTCGKHDQTCKAQARLEALETLVFTGQSRDDHLSEIYDARASFGYYEQVELARLLVRLPAWHNRGIALRDKLLERVYETGRYATVNTPGEWIETPAAGQAQVVSLMVDTKMPAAAIDKAAAALLAMRSNGTWPCAPDAAEALQALAGYARLQPVPPNFTASAKAGVQTVAASFDGYARTSVQQTIPIASLPSGRSDVVLTKSGDGTLHYTLAYRYAIDGAAPGAFAGIRVDRFVRVPGTETPVLSFGLGAISSPVALDAGKVFEIEDRIAVDHPVDRVVITDPLPAGIEAIDAAFRTSTQAYAVAGDSWSIDYQQIYRDHVLAYASHLEAGVYAIHYLVRTVTPGTFSWPGAEGYLELAPEEFGRAASSTVTISLK